MSTNDRNPFGYSDSERAAWAQDIDPADDGLYITVDAPHATVADLAQEFARIRDTGGGDLPVTIDGSLNFAIWRDDDGVRVDASETENRTELTPAFDEGPMLSDWDGVDRGVAPSVVEQLRSGAPLTQESIDALADKMQELPNSYCIDRREYRDGVWHRVTVPVPFEKTVGRMGYIPGGSFTVANGMPIERYVQLSVAPNGERITVETPSQRLGAIGETQAMTIDVEPCAQRVTYEKGHPINVECACNGLRGELCAVLGAFPPEG
jgi:hypothetical protein